MEFCADRHIACLDLLPAFKSRKDEEFYRDKDDHLNQKGDHVAGQLILDFLLKNTTVGSRRNEPNRAGNNSRQSSRAGLHTRT
jgi:hypothetical protein